MPILNLGRDLEDLVGASFSTGPRDLAQLAQEKNRVPQDGALTGAGGAVSALGQAIDLVGGTIAGFWHDEAIDAQRWNKRYPYQLLVLRLVDGQYTRDEAWEFTLPVPPEALTVGMPFAIDLRVTPGGIVEEHGGTRIRPITIQGTTGVLPNRDTAASDFGVPDAEAIAGGLLSNTINAAVDAGSTLFNRVVAATGGRTDLIGNLMDEGSLGDGRQGKTGRGTGYYQFHLLRLFLEGYANLKTTAAGRNCRLALAMWKDQAVYLVTPQNFEMRRTASQGPLDYTYSLQFKAWRRVKLDNQPTALGDYRGRANSPNFLQTTLGAIATARAALEGARSVLAAVVTDTERLFEPLRQVTLLLKDSVGVGVAVVDLPRAVSEAATGAAVEATVGLIEFQQQALAAGGPAITARTPGATSQAQSSAFNARGEPLATSEKTKRLEQLASPFTKAFGVDSAKNFAQLSKISVDKLELKPSVRRLVTEEIERVRRLRRPDIETFRDQIQAFAADYADGVGAGSDAYNAIYNRAPKPTNKTPTDLDFQLLWAMNQVVQEFSRLSIATPEASASLAYLESTATLSRRSEITFREPVSKFAIPVPFGVTLEQIAARYLGDPNRWGEIAALNGLRSPYVDEVGFDLPLVVNGKGKTVVVSTAENLYVGQRVTLRASDAPPTRRRITGIDVTPTMVFVHVDGAEDMDRYKLVGLATLHAWLPDTLNSQGMVYIPSERPIAQDLTTRPIPGLRYTPETVARGGIDLLITQSGDAAITADGDWRLAIGIQNLAQRARIALDTPRGSLPQHPAFGLGLTAGINSSDLDAKDLLIAAKGMFNGDPDFAGINGVRISKNGPGMTVRLDLAIAGEETLLPVAFSVKR